MPSHINILRFTILCLMNKLESINRGGVLRVTVIVCEENTLINIATHINTSELCIDRYTCVLFVCPQFSFSCRNNSG